MGIGSRPLVDIVAGGDIVPDEESVWIANLIQCGIGAQRMSSRRPLQDEVDPVSDSAPAISPNDAAAAPDTDTGPSLDRVVNGISIDLDAASPAWPGGREAVCVKGACILVVVHDRVVARDINGTIGRCDAMAIARKVIILHENRIGTAERYLLVPAIARAADCNAIS